MTKGSAPALRPLPTRSTFAAPVKTTYLVPGRSPSRSLGTSPRYRLAAFLGRCTRVASISLLQPTFTLRAPEKTSLLETARRAPWENPPTFDIETALGHRLSPAASCGAGPPCGHPTSNSSALDGASTGFGPFDSLLPTVRPDVPRCHAEGEAPRLYRPKVPLSNRTL